MDDKTIKALQGSITKWDRIAKGEIRDRGTDNCPLCAVFWGPDGATAERCRGCPVALNTGVTTCNGSPYLDFVASLVKYDHGEITPAGRRLALAERDYLNSLLPYLLRKDYEEKKSDSSSPVSDAASEPVQDSLRGGSPG